jgi:hypothetical protein
MIPPSRRSKRAYTSGAASSGRRCVTIAPGRARPDRTRVAQRDGIAPVVRAVEPDGDALGEQRAPRHPQAAIARVRLGRGKVVLHVHPGDPEPASGVDQAAEVVDDLRRPLPGRVVAVQRLEADGVDAAGDPVGRSSPGGRPRLRRRRETSGWAPR